jgi:hypothetical protein
MPPSAPVTVASTPVALPSSARILYPLHPAAHDEARPFVGGVLEERLHRRALAALLAAARAVAAGGGVVAGGIGVAVDHLVLVTEAVEAGDQLAVGAVLRGNLGVDAEPLPDRVEVRVEVRPVEPVEAHRRPL